MISDWCRRWGMMVNPNKTRGMLISRFRTIEPLFLNLVIGDSVVEMVSELKILGPILDSKLAFERHVRAIAVSASKRVGIMRKTMSVFRNVAIVDKCTFLGIPTYCAGVLFSNLDVGCHFLDRVFGRVSKVSGGSVRCDIWHRRRMTFRCVFFKIETVWLVCNEETNPWSFDCSLMIF